MKAKSFKLFDAINREGLDNSHWGLCEDIASTKIHFGSVEDIELKGQYVYVYRDDVKAEYSFLKGIKADYHLIEVFNGRCSMIDIYKL